MTEKKGRINRYWVGGLFTILALSPSVGSLGGTGAGVLYAEMITLFLKLQPCVQPSGALLVRTSVISVDPAALRFV